MDDEIAGNCHSITDVLTTGLEDDFQVGTSEHHISRRQWDRVESHLECNARLDSRVLDQSKMQGVVTVLAHVRLLVHLLLRRRLRTGVHKEHQ